jgi:hypothetical protein
MAACARTSSRAPAGASAGGPPSLRGRQVEPRTARRVSERLVTASELAEILGLSPAAVLNKWERGEFDGYKIGPTKNAPVRFNVDEVLASFRRPARRRLEVVPDEE